MTKIYLKVKTQAKKNLVEPVAIVPGWEQPGLMVNLTCPAVDGLANNQLIKILATYYQLKPNQISISSGIKHHLKIVELDR